jgi:formate dehydrogenase subunit delta
VNSIDKLVYMANQIARNFAVEGDAAAINATADHIEKFWDPRMKALIKQHSEGLSTVAAAAVRQLAVHDAAS